MSLLHATWLFPAEGEGGRLLVWADTWRVAQPVEPADMAPDHPFALSRAELKAWLEELNLLPAAALDTTEPSAGAKAARAHGPAALQGGRSPAAAARAITRIGHLW